MTVTFQPRQHTGSPEWLRTRRPGSPEHGDVRDGDVRGERGDTSGPIPPPVRLGARRHHDDRARRRPRRHARRHATAELGSPRGGQQRGVLEPSAAASTATASTATAAGRAHARGCRRAHATARCGACAHVHAARAEAIGPVAVTATLRRIARQEPAARSLRRLARAPTGHPDTNTNITTNTSAGHPGAPAPRRHQPIGSRDSFGFERLEPAADGRCMRGRLQAPRRLSPRLVDVRSRVRQARDPRHLPRPGLQRLQPLRRVLVCGVVPRRRPARPAHVLGLDGLRDRVPRQRRLYLRLHRWAGAKPCRGAARLQRLRARLSRRRLPRAAMRSAGSLVPGRITSRRAGGPAVHGVRRQLVGREDRHGSQGLGVGQGQAPPRRDPIRTLQGAARAGAVSPVAA